MRVSFELVSWSLAGASCTLCSFAGKTKLMNQKGAVGTAGFEFKGPIDTFVKLFQREGIKGLYRGWSEALDETSAHGRRVKRMLVRSAHTRSRL